MTEMKMIRDEAEVGEGKEKQKIYTYGLIDMAPGELIQVIEGLKCTANPERTIALGERLLAFAMKAKWIQVSYQVGAIVPAPPKKPAKRGKRKTSKKKTGPTAVK